MSGQTSIGTTQPFTDSAEVRRCAGVTLPILPQDQEAPEEQPELVPTALASHNSPLDELAEAVTNASLTTTLPDARLVFACPAGSTPDGSDPVIIRLPKDIAG